MQYPKNSITATGSTVLSGSMTIPAKYLSPGSISGIQINAGNPDRNKIYIYPYSHKIQVIHMIKNGIVRVFRNSFVITACMLIFQTRCSSERSHKLQVREYEEVMLKGSKSIYDFFIKLEPDSAYLDSALMYLNTAAKYECAKHNKILYNKGFVYFHKRDYEKAIESIDSIDSTPFALYKSIIIEKIEAKRAENRGDIRTRNMHYGNIVKNIDGYIDRFLPVFDSIMRLPDEAAIWNDSIFMGYFYERTYYRAKIIGLDNITRELDSLQEQKAYNRDYIDELKKDIEGPLSGRITGSISFE